MRTVYCGKDWSEKPTYVEVVAFSSQQEFKALVEGYTSFYDGPHWFSVRRYVLDNSESRVDWVYTLSKLDGTYGFLEKCPNYIQDWFHHLYDLTLLLEE